MPPRPTVLIACPNDTGWMHKSVVLQVIRMLSDARFESTFIAPTHAPYVTNLHKITHEVIARGFDYLISIDDDNPPAPGVNVLDLVELGLDIVGCPTPVWHCDDKAPGDRPYYYNALREVEDDDGSIAFRPLDSEPGFKCAGIQRCDAVGTGCIVIARRVLEVLHARALELGPLEAPFMRRWNNKGQVVMGNDFAFCQRARAAGFEVWAHFDYVCQHFNELELTEAVNGMARFMLGVNRG